MDRSDALKDCLPYAAPAFRFKDEEMISKPRFPKSKGDDDDDKVVNVFKVVTVGDPGVGKTSIIQRFSEDVFYSDPKAKMGVVMKEVDVNGKPVELCVWDSNEFMDRHVSCKNSAY